MVRPGCEVSTLYDIFWWCSAVARLDAKDAQTLMVERTHRGLKSGLSIPEEVTTFNLVRQLASQRRRRGGNIAVALHNRWLEGRWWRLFPPSGADLEMAVEVRPGRWVDLAIQAKRIYPDGRYREWDPPQLAMLQSWASANGGRTPAALLYNAEFGPFGPPGTLVDLEACCQRSVMIHGWKWPRWPDPNGRSPAAITLVILPGGTSPMPSTIAVPGPPAMDVNEFAMPYECIFCERWEESGFPPNGSLAKLPLRDGMPDWASRLVSAIPNFPEGYLIEDPQDYLTSAAFSVVLPYLEEVEAAEDF
jgi:hypothetical protein